MEIGFAQCETIMKTLPIGYYAGRRVDVTLDKDEKTSFYSPMEDKIVVSYPIIAERMSKAPATLDAENAIRAMLYHEVSHAILTPPSLDASTSYNIFEDERIETVLADYYMGVNFKQQLWDLHDNKVPTPKNPDMAFYNAVRFRCAPPDILEEIDEIIYKHRKMSRQNESGCWDYEWEIDSLYRKIAGDYRSNPKDYQPQSGEGEKKEGEKEENEEGQQMRARPSDEESNSGDQQIPQGQAIAMSDKELEEVVKGALSIQPQLNPTKQKQIDEFTKTVETIISNFNKKNNGGSGINAYSGVFNPRSISRQDYRYFERSMSTQGNNKFGTCHLNLFIDCSGSMGSNERIVNAMLASLSEIERKNRNFSMDVSFINEGYHDCKSVRERRFVARGGNTIPSDMKERFIKRQLPNTCNYNVVLFDGDCFSDEWCKDEEKLRRFGAFDYKQTTVITDPDNKHLVKNFHASKVVVTDNYTDELIKHVTKALTIAFA